MGASAVLFGCCDNWQLYPPEAVFGHLVVQFWLDHGGSQKEGGGAALEDGFCSNTRGPQIIHPSRKGKEARRTKRR